MESQTALNIFSTKEDTRKFSFNIQELKNEPQLSVKTENDSNQSKQNICHICNKPFSTIGNMRNHILTIHENYRPFACTYPGCNKKYSIESRYLVHLRTHKGAKPYVCQICNKTFNEKGNLKTHLRFHSELRPFKCPHCTKCYKTNGHLKDHIEIQHKLIKKYFCNSCNKKFGRISTLKAHIRTHTGEKKFKCRMEGCDKSFAEKGNMEIHYNRHLKKLNKFDINAKNKKKYGEKTIEKEYEEKIKEAIDKLKDVNNNLNSNKMNKSIFKKSCDKKVFKLYNTNKILLNSNNSQGLLPNMHNFVNKNGIYNNIIIQNVNILPKKNDKIHNFKIIKEDNSFNQNVNNILKNHCSLNNFPNNEQNFVNIGNESQNFLGYLGLYPPLIPEFHPMEPLIPQENNNLLIKENNDLNIDISNCITRPSSIIALCMKKKADDIFAKEEDLLSVGEDFPKNNNYKINNDNIYINENIDMQFNQEYSENQPNVFINNFNNNFNEIN